MLKQWIEQCLELSEQPADIWSGCRKILRGVTFTIPNLDHDMVMNDCGFTKSKSSMLRRNYLHAESRDTAKALWEKRVAQEKYGSVGFSCYNHLIKGGGQTSMWAEVQAKREAAKNGVKFKANRSSVMGPCIQSIVLTWMKKGHVEVDIFYRTTEMLKKFPADLVFIRDELLHDFDLSGLKGINFHFANVTMHPMYYVTIIPHLGDKVFAELDSLKKRDKRMYEWVIKWTARYLCPEHLRGIQKFAQAMRTRGDGIKRIDPKIMKKLQAYLRKNHPGYRSEYVDPDGEEE